MEPFPTRSQSQKNRILIVVITGAVIAALAAGSGMYAFTKSKYEKVQADLHNQISALKNQINATEAGKSVGAHLAPQPTVTPTPNATSTYTNTRFGYSFTYPANSLQLRGSIGDDYNLPITDGYMTLDAFAKGGPVGRGIFSVSILGIALTPEAIQEQFYGSTRAEDALVIPAVIGGSNGYKIPNPNFYNSSGASTLYFVKAADGTVLELTVTDHNALAQSILNSFQFTKQ